MKEGWEERMCNHLKRVSPIKGGMVMLQFACLTHDPRVAGSKHGSITVLFPQTGNFPLHCFSSLKCINGYEKHTCT